jgi:sec-independent protein translocase protein TatA
MMGGLSLPHLIVLALVVLILFGRGRISDMMGDFGKGIKSFKEGMSDETNRPVTPPPSQIPTAPIATSQTPPAAPPTAEPAPQPVQTDNQWPKA